MKNISKRTGKKGQFTYLNAIIIALVVAILLLIIAQKVQTYIGAEGKIGACGASILKSSFLDKTVSYGIKQGTLKCNDLPNTEIASSDVVLSSGKINDNAVKSKIAQAMLGCWKMIGRGSVDPFKAYDNDQTYCLICSNVIFDKDFVDLAKQQNYKINDSIYWMATNNVPGLTTSYLQELYGINITSDVLANLRAKDLPIDVSQQYAVIWRLETIKSSLSGAVATGGAGFISGGFVGAKAGSVIGAGLGGFVGGVGAAPGAVAGALIGTAGGSVAGFFGALKLSNLVFGDKTLANEILVVPKIQLGQNAINTTSLSDPSKTEQKDFCTKLVNR